MVWEKLTIKNTWKFVYWEGHFSLLSQAPSWTWLCRSLFLFKILIFCSLWIFFTLILILKYCFKIFLI